MYIYVNIYIYVYNAYNVMFLLYTEVVQCDVYFSDFINLYININKM